MKTTVLLLVFALSVFAAHAQYKTYKENYNVKSYSWEKTDTYYPAIAGALAIVPGLGHVYANEPLRGLAFFGSVVGSAGIGFLGFYLSFTDVPGLPVFLICSGVTGVITTYTMNILDAVKVSKIKNMAINSGGITFHIEPVMKIHYEDHRYGSIGISVKLNF